MVAPASEPAGAVVNPLGKGQPEATLPRLEKLSSMRPPGGPKRLSLSQKKLSLTD